MVRILIPIDFSECSINALKYGLKYAQMLESKPEIIVVHGYNIPIPAAEFSMSLNANILEEFKGEAEEKFEKLRKRIPELEQFKAKFDIKLAFALDAIMKCIQEEKADLVIMGTKGATGLNEVLFGSNTSGVIKASKVPVIAIPENFKRASISRITFAFDNKKLEDISRLDIIKRLSSTYGAPVDVLHIQTDSEEGNDKLGILAEYFKNVPHEFHVIEGKEIAEGVEKFLATANSDLLAMIPRKHKLMERLFTGSLTKKMAHHTTIPLLTIPA